MCEPLTSKGRGERFQTSSIENFAIQPDNITIVSFLHVQCFFSIARYEDDLEEEFFYQYHVLSPNMMLLSSIHPC